ncbi:MAG: hypothetical protein H5T73_03240 [Actinobacteria bacterium]|nr:hypothetical protein [Actinomycetota bacterium]
MTVRDEMIMRSVVLEATKVRDIWMRHDLGTRYERMLKLEKRSAGKGFNLTEEQIRLLEKHNPEFAEFHIVMLYPGYLPSKNTFYVGMLKSVGRLSEVRQLLDERIPENVFTMGLWDFSQNGRVTRRAASWLFSG